ncbi:hypothetical protein [Nitrosopumilus sp.]|uniref:hypothetical protein n=1 Tax=Nitrosopumilus sp. TaxID=2024843 RepID=UPI00292EF47D|nr:hypothetical protein [Nitrosopumilus sp.]
MTKGNWMCLCGKHVSKVLSTSNCRMKHQRKQYSQNQQAVIITFLVREEHDV